MYHAAYRWLAWIGLWLLIAANARADAISRLPAARASSENSATFWGVVAMTLVLVLWAVVINAIARSRARRVLAEVTQPKRKRPPFPS